MALLTVLVGIALPALFLGVGESMRLHTEWLGEMAKHNASLIYAGGDNYNAVDTVYSFLHRAGFKHVIAAPNPAVSDPGVLARLTRVPRVVWNTTFVVVLAAASWLVGQTVLDASGVLG
jgi:hypothetical protein